MFYIVYRYVQINNLYNDYVDTNNLVNDKLLFVTSNMSTKMKYGVGAK